MPHPVITRRRLKEILRPEAGERLLELGPGAGYYSTEVARALEPGGQLELLDIQQEMLDHALRKASDEGVSNVSATLGDAQKLPYESDSIDGAFLVTVLGEIPDQEAALRELSRVVRPGGRVVVGEIAIDPHFVRLSSLNSRAGEAGLLFESMSGGRLAYFARFSV